MSPIQGDPLGELATPCFLHDDPEFPALLGIAQAQSTLDVEFVEKDYWVTHVLWWLQRNGFGVSFKGGTSLSKCFGLIRRFSEDIDVRLDTPSTMQAPPVRSWAISGASDEALERLAYFDWLEDELKSLPGIASVRYERTRHAPRHLNAVYFLEYDSCFQGTQLSLQRSVQLELAPDVIYASVPRPAMSLVHDAIPPQVLSRYIVNRPEAITCVHPLATLLGKLDAICNQHARAVDPSRYIRHFEDAYHIIHAIPSLPPLPEGMTVRSLAARMREDNQIRTSYGAADPAFELADAQDRAALEDAHAALDGWHWGGRVPLMDTCQAIRSWLAQERIFS